MSAVAAGYDDANDAVALDADDLLVNVAGAGVVDVDVDVANVAAVGDVDAVTKSH